MNNNLPEDVINEEILPLLPIKSLFRFKSVCKSWRSYISNPTFEKLHMIHTNKNPNNESFIAHSKDSFLYPKLFVINKNFVDRFIGFKLHSSTPPEGLNVVGSSNGLLCLAYMQKINKIYLWNPATRQLKAINHYTIMNSDRLDVSLGFGFDHASSDYKVVRIVTDSTFYYVPRVEVYSVNENSWKKIKLLAELNSLVFKPLCATIVNGSPYWIVKDKHVHQRLVLVSFNMQSEKFRTTLLPRAMCTDDYRCYNIFEFRESVAVSIGQYIGTYICIWTPDHDSCWIKKLVITTCPLTAILGYLKTGEFVGRTTENKLVLYNHVSEELKLTPYEFSKLETYTYSESLVNLN